jgi:Zn-dependent peptidase ImmA (M78 family)
MEKRVRELKASLGLPPDRYPVDALDFASALGVMVYEVEFTTPDIALLTITDRRRVPEGAVPGERATLLLARGKTPLQKTFAVAHGLGHALLGHVGEEGLLTDFSGGDFASRPEEREANAFALALLMPETPFRRAWEALAGRGVHHVGALFGVSANAAVARAWELGLEVPLP